MKIETTINVRTDLLEKLLIINQELKTSLNNIVLILLSKAINWSKKPLKTIRSIKYQTKKGNVGWYKLHISLDNVMYERCLDFRKLYKLSVSYILAICIEKYLELIRKELTVGKKTDNYSNFYLFFINYDENFFSFTAFWDWPGEKILKKTLLL